MKTLLDAKFAQLPMPSMIAVPMARLARPRRLFASHEVVNVICTNVPADMRNKLRYRTAAETSLPSEQAMLIAQPVKTELIPPRMKGNRRPIRAGSQADESCDTIPAIHRGMGLAWASLAVHPSSVKIVGMKPDMLAAVKSQQKNMRVFCGTSQRPAKIYIPEDLRKYDLIVEDHLDPVRPLHIDLLLPLIQSQRFEQVLFIR